MYGGNMKVIDLVNKIYNNEIRDNTKIKFINEPSATIWEYKTNFNTLSCGIMNKDLLMCLDDEIEIIEESKEELEEIELIDIHYVNDKCIFKVYGQSIEETIAIKVNELIDEVNKLKKERRMNNE
jgi:hypothetical protein